MQHSHHSHHPNSHHLTTPEHESKPLLSIRHDGTLNNLASTSTSALCHSVRFFTATLLSLFVLYLIYHVAISPSTAPHIPKNRLSSNSHIQIVAPTILISLDGFRHEYLSRRKSPKNTSNSLLAPTLHDIATHGAYAPHGMQPVMPSKTRPNHWSLATGLFPESGGIIANQMYDPVRQAWFKSSRDDPSWYAGSPIWNTLRNRRRVVMDQSGRLARLSENYTTACVFWPGSEVEKYAANVFWRYDDGLSYEHRVRRVISLLRGTADDLDGPAQFVTLYLKAVDIAGHRFGPHSPEVDAAIERVDAAVALLLQSLGGDAASVNVVIVSDHGMTEVSEDQTCDLESSIQEGSVQDIRTSPMGLFLNRSVSAEQVYKSIHNYLEGHEQCAKAYMKQDLPNRWHLKSSRLIPPIVTMANLGWTVKYPHQQLVPGARMLIPKPVARRRELKGDHGFDNLLYPDMQAVFLAQGPAFRPGSTVTSMRAVDVYEMLCYIFYAEPAQNNGTLERTLSSILRTRPR